MEKVPGNNENNKEANTVSERELLEIIAVQVGKLTKDVDEIKETITTLATKEELAEIRSTMATKEEFAEIRSTMATKEELAEIRSTMATKEELAEIRSTMATKEELAEIRSTMATKEELEEIKNIVIRIENDHGQKLNALFDGYNLNSEKLDRIEKEVAKHEEFILRRIR